MVNSAVISVRTTWGARLGFVCTLAAVLTANLLGRMLQRQANWLVDIIPVAGIIVFGFGFFLVRRHIKKSSRAFSKESLQSFATHTLLFFTVGVMISETLSTLPIERIHFVKYSFLSFFAYYSQQRGSARRRALTSAMLTFAIGGLEEATQYWLPNRFFDLNDICLNTSGAFYGATIGYAIERLLGRLRAVSAS